MSVSEKPNEGGGVVPPPRTRLKRPRSAFGPFLQSINPYSNPQPLSATLMASSSSSINSGAQHGERKPTGPHVVVKRSLVGQPHHPQLFTRIMAAQNAIIFESSGRKGGQAMINRCCSPSTTVGRQVVFNCSGPGPGKNATNLILNPFSANRSRTNIFMRQRYSIPESIC